MYCVQINFAIFSLSVPAAPFCLSEAYLDLILSCYSSRLLRDCEMAAAHWASVSASPLLLDAEVACVEAMVYGFSKAHICRVYGLECRV